MSIYRKFNNQSIINIINKEIAEMEAAGFGDYVDADFCKDRYHELELEYLADEADTYAYNEWRDFLAICSFEYFMGQLQADIEHERKFGAIEDAADDLAEQEYKEEMARNGIG